MTNDPIADMLTRIRNANERKHARVEIPASKVKVRIAEILKNEGYISDYKIEKLDKVKSNIVITLKYKSKSKVITGIKRISKPGLRVYVECEKLPIVLNGYGIAIISTSKGIITNMEAKELNIGGEILAHVW